MTVVGTAEILIVPETAGFVPALEAETQGGFGKFKSDAEIAGEDAGANLRGGVKKETSKLAEDMEKDGTRGGAGLEKGASGGLSKLASLISNTGVPLGGLSKNLEKSASAAEHAGKSSSGFVESLGGAAGPLAATGVVLGIAGVAAIKLGEGMESSEAKIAGAAGTSVASAKKIGDALLDTAGKSEFSGNEMASAFAEVAGQLKATEGHALSAGEATKVMAAASNLAEAKQISLGEATATLSKTMQAFGLKTTESAHVSDVLYQASNATGQSVEGLANQLTKVRSKLGETAGSVGQMSGLLVDMTDHGITGRAAMAALNTGMNTLQKSATGVATATQEQNAVYAQMDPSLKALADGYRDGSVSSKDFKKELEGLPPQQAAIAESFEKSAKKVQEAQVKFKDMGIEAFNAQGKFVGMGSIIDQLHPKFERMTQAQQLAAATTLFGAGAARQMTAIIDAGPAAYDKATAAVEKHGTAESAAKKQAETLHGEIKTLSATMVDLGTKIGLVLIPIVTAFGKALIYLTNITIEVVNVVKQHWELLPLILAAPIIPFVAIWKLMGVNMIAVMRDVANWIENAWHTVETDTEHLVDSVTGFFSALPGKVAGFFTGIAHDAAGVWHEIESGVSGLVGNVTSFFGELPGKFSASSSTSPAPCSRSANRWWKGSSTASNTSRAKSPAP